MSDAILKNHFVVPMFFCAFLEVQIYDLECYNIVY